MKRFIYRGIISPANMFFHFISFTVLIFLFSIPSFAQNNLTLSAAIEKGLKNNFQILIAKDNSTIAANNNTPGAAGFLPNFNINLTDANRLQKIDNPASFLNGDVRIIGLTGQVEMGWVIFNGFRAWINKSRLEHLQSVAEGRESIVIQNTLQAIILAYYDALVEKEKLAVLEKTVQISGDRFKYMQDKKERGTSSTFETLQSELAWQNDRQNLLLQKQNLSGLMIRLNQLMGEPAESEYILTDKLTFKPVDFSLEELKKTLVRDNDALKNEYINQEILRKQYENERAGMFPRVSVNIGAQQSASDFKLNDFPSRKGSQTDYYGNFVLSFNLYNGGAVRRNMQNTALQQHMGKLSMEEMKLSLSNQLVSEHRFYAARTELYNISESILKNSRLNLQLAEEKFKNGTITSFDYRDIQLATTRAEISNLETIYNLLISETEIMRLTGALMKRVAGN